MTPKSLSPQKTDLIHSSKNSGKINQCSVEVHFKEIYVKKNQNEDNSVPGGEIIITRTAYANSTSKYFINGTTATLSDVTSVLRQKGVDLDHKRFLILQEKIDDASKQVDELNEIRAEKLRRVKIIEREKASLESKKNESVNYVLLENEVSLKKNALYQLRLAESNEGCKKSAELFESVKNKFSSEQSKTPEREEVQLLETQKHLSNKLKKLDKAEDEVNSTIKSNNETIKRAEDDIKKGNEELIQLQQKLIVEKNELEKIVEQLKGKTEGLTEELREKQKELEPWREKISSEKSKFAVLSTEIDLIKSKYNSNNGKVERFEKELMELRKNRSNKDKEMNLKVEEYGETEINIQNLKEKIESMMEAYKQLQIKVQDAIQAEQEAKMSLNSSQSQSAVLKSLLKERDLGRINGIFGRLGSLGTISDKYDVAISTACPGLESIVVQNVSSGQQCVEFLRKNNIGRARFVMLDELNKFDLTKKSYPEGVSRLFDLVKPTNPKFAPAFYHALTNTLVAKDMEQARRIAYGSTRYRVVTLDGKLIDASGTMSGGGNRIMRGAMSSVASQDGMTVEKFKKLTDKRIQLESELANYGSLIEKAKKDSQNLENKYQELERVLPKTEMDLKAADELVKECKRQLNEQKAQESKGPTPEEEKKLQELESKLKVAEKKISSLQKECSTIEDEIKKLNSMIMQAGGVKLRTQTSKVESINEQISLINENIDNYESIKNRANAEIARISRSSAKKMEEKAGISNQLEHVIATINKKKVEIKAISDKAKEARDHLDDKRDALDSLKSELDSRQSEFNSIRTKEAQLKMEIDDAERALAENQRRTNYLKSELGRIKLQTLPPEIELSEPLPQSLPVLLPDALAELDPGVLDREITQGDAKLQNAKPNLSVLTEYARRTTELKNHTDDLDKTTKERDDALNSYNELHKQRLDKFMEGFNAISYKLKEMYQLITMGGSAELELVDSLDPFVEGIVFSVMPPKKSWKNISDLSGGEKTLSSLALVFSLHQFKPTPIYVMDEIDAALDFRNVSIVANYIKQRTENAQFIVISLRNNMFELADWLVGIYKTDNKTKSITFDPKPTEQILRN
ncbi:hypothetical protein BB559_002387 [Furculomyces boomerangus]|uniref:Structural maintenance of chromosomes protein 4 n=1 Tax=Furculomyces boomerangus TaxID=61424 RepID=A0A2T9YVV4_9FUNG|nr:hypothetical protein BB559_002387 [Furculomyces boomerangus]